jgi:phenylpropionate dioxygenase-like ring-hydroxylating dioxygenase large terminal subunit
MLPPAYSLQTVEELHWHPLCLCTVLEDQPQAFRLLGWDLVLWQDHVGGVHAWLDRCPHRGAALSLGCVVASGGESVLQCGYHGWRFGGDARCVQVPAQPEWRPPAGHRAKAFHARKWAGMIWVCLAESVPALPTWEEADDSRFVQAISGPYDVPTSAPRLVENFLDMTHFGFVHAGYLGDPAHTGLAAYEVHEHAGGITVPDCAVWQPKAFSEGDADAGRIVRYRYDVIAPYTARLEKISDQGGEKLVIVMLNCPIDDEHTRTWFYISAQGLGQTPAEMAAFQDTIFAQDSPIVCSQTPKRLPLVGSELHGPLDRVSAAYRRYLLRMGVQTGVLS